jgi:hypothetical protein
MEKDYSNMTRNFHNFSQKKDADPHHFCTLTLVDRVCVHVWAGGWYLDRLPSTNRVRRCMSSRLSIGYRACYWTQYSRVQTQPMIDFKSNKNPQHDFLRRGSKAVGSMSQDFTAC